MKRVAVALVLCTAAGVALADNYLDFRMLATPGQPFGFYMDSRNANPAGLAYSSVQTATERAFQTWNAVTCSSVKVSSLGPSQAAVPNPTSTTDAFSVAPIWLLTNDADAQEIFGNLNFVAAITIPRAYAGVLQTCDVYLNAVGGFGRQWSIDMALPDGGWAGSEDVMDLQTVMLHETGHCLGLGHLIDATSVMYQHVESGQAYRVLQSADISYLCARYPAVGSEAAPCNSDGSCNGADLKCLPQPVTNGFSASLCTRGCPLGGGSSCAIPFTCQPSSEFPGFGGACLLPGGLVTEVGKACTRASDCGSSFAQCRIPENASGNHHFWEDGYCTQSCEAGDPVCPAGSTCVTLDVGRRCAQSCRVGAADCRPEYSCAQIDDIGTSGVCIPSCYADADCANPTTITCRTCDGLCVARQNVVAQIGDGCRADSECGAGQVCRAADVISPVKQCTQQCARGCALCPSGSTCTPGVNGELFCIRDCTGPGTCPQGLRCADTTLGKGCLPSCTRDADCPVGQACYLGECYTPVVDAGCMSLCNKPDSGNPIVVVPKDAGNGGGGLGGCGCSSFQFDAALGMLSILFLRRRRPSCQQQ